MVTAAMPTVTALKTRRLVLKFAMTPGMGYQEEASDLHVETMTYSGCIESQGCKMILLSNPRAHSQIVMHSLATQPKYTPAKPSRIRTFDFNSDR